MGHFPNSSFIRSAFRPLLPLLLRRFPPPLLTEEASDSDPRLKEVEDWTLGAAAVARED